MGDITDWMHQSGMLDYPDPFEHEEPREYSPRTQLACKYCGSTKVSWGHQEGKWRLFDKGSSVQPHTCWEYAATNRR